MSAADYTTKELMAAFVASEIRDDETVSVGASLPVPRAASAGASHARAEPEGADGVHHD